MKIVLTRFPELQVDCDGRGLVLTYDQQDEEIRVVDKRNAAGVFCYATPQWPFDDPTGDVGPLCPGSNMVTYMVASRLELADANRPPISSTARPRRTVLRFGSIRTVSARTIGLFFTGAFVWRTGFLKQLDAHKSALALASFSGLIVGGLLTAIDADPDMQARLGSFAAVVDGLAPLVLAFGYGSLILYLAGQPWGRIFVG